ncbi:MAG: copper oxidase, partial [Burkholderiaceae bacterium]
AYEWTGSLPKPARVAAAGGKSMPVQNMPAGEVEVQVRKPVMGGMGGMKH